MREPHGDQAVVARAEAGLERLVPAQEAVLGHAVGRRGAHRVGEQHEANSVARARRVPPGLVYHSRPPVRKPYPGRGGPPVELEDPEPQPAVRKRAGCEIVVERLRSRAEHRGSRAEARRVQREQDLEVLCQAGGVVGQTEVQPVVSREAPLTPAQALAEVGAARGQIRVPVAAERERRARLAAQDDTIQQPLPAGLGRQALGEHQPALVLDGSRERAGGQPAVRRCADRAELVTGPVPDPAQRAQRAAAGATQGQDRRERAVGAPAGAQRERSRPAPLAPPRISPRPCRERAAGATLELLPLRAQHAQVVEDLQPRRRPGPHGAT